MTQAQKQRQKQNQSQKQKQTQVGVQAEIPLFISNSDEEDILEIDEDISIDQNEDESFELPDDIEEEEKMSNFEGVEISDDIENYMNENISIPFRHYPIAEINFDGGRLFIAPRLSRSIKTSKLLATICQKIILTNKKFLIEKSDVSNLKELSQNELITEAKFKIDKSVLSRFIDNNYITLPNGFDYPLSIFFSHTSGKKIKNEDNIEEFFQKVIARELNNIENNNKEGAEITIELLYSDSKITEEFSKEFNKVDRRTIARYRAKYNVKPIEERLTDYKIKYES
jgi:hypothetical protein